MLRECQRASVVLCIPAIYVYIYIYIYDNVSLLHACIRLDAQARAHISTSHESIGYANRYACAGVQTRGAY